MPGCWTSSTSIRRGSKTTSGNGSAGSRKPDSSTSSSRVRKKLDRWRALSRHERGLLVGLVFLLPAIGIALRLLGFRRTSRLLRGSTESTTARAEVSAESQALAMRLGQLVSIASRHGPYRRSACGNRSRSWLLRRRGLPAEVRVGVGKHDGRVRAHAWGDWRAQSSTTVRRLRRNTPPMGLTAACLARRHETFRPSRTCIA